MPKFRKKPVVIEAMRCLPIDIPRDKFNNIADKLEYADEFDDWIAEKVPDARYVGNTLEIPTLEGKMTASDGDWIIIGISGEAYPCKPDIFLATYEEVKE